MSALLWLLSCSGRALDAPDPVAEGLVDFEARMTERVQPDALEQAIALGWALLDDHPGEPRVLHALADAYVARAHHRTDAAALDDLNQAYQLSWRCLGRNPGWRSRLEVAGGRVVPDATARLLATDLPCMDTALISLGTRMQVRGPAGWVDLREVGLLADAAMALDVEQVDWVPPWSQGLVLTLSPDADDEARASGAAAYREATRRQPDRVTAAVDRLSYVLARQGDRATLVRAVNAVRQRHSPVRPDHEWALENRRGLERLEALLEDTAP